MRISKEGRLRGFGKRGSFVPTVSLAAALWYAAHLCKGGVPGGGEESPARSLLGDHTFSFLLL